MNGELERLHAALVGALRRTRTTPFDGPVTVAEIYQDLVPYRAVRTALGFEMNADYEHTLLRLLSGEGDFARLDPPEARDELRDELDSPNPNVGLFRKFAGCDVWVVAGEAPAGSDADAWADAAPDEDEEPWHVEPLDPPPGQAASAGGAPTWGGTQPEPASAAEPARSPADEPEPLREAAARGRDDRPGDESRPAAEAERTPPGRPADEPLAVAADEDDGEEPEFELVPVQRRSAAAEEGDGRQCAFCDASLPERRMLRYCPFCGADQSQRPCGSCGEPLEPGWRYCVACGGAAE